MKPQRQMLADIRAAPRDEQRRVVARRDGPTPWETEGEGLPDDLPEEERVLDAMGSEEDGRETPSESFPDKTPRAEENSSSSEGVGLYLKQMGSIPLLDREQELELSRRLDTTRRRYRRAALCNPDVLEHAAAAFAQTLSGERPLDRTIDTVPSLRLTRGKIQKRLPGHLAQLRRLLREAARAFEQLRGARSEAERLGLLRGVRQVLRRGVRLVEELSPSTTLVQAWAEEARRRSHLPLADADQPREEPGSGVWQARAREQLARWVRVLDRRRAVYLEVRQELAAASLRLVIAVAKQYQGRGLPLADLIQEGNSSLMRAVDKFDFRLGWRFATYAAWWVRQGVTRALEDSSRVVRVPCYRVAMIRQVERGQVDLLVEHQRDPKPEEVAEKLQISPAEVRSLLLSARPLLSLDGSFGDQDEHSLLGRLVDQDAADPSEEADRLLLKERISQLLRSLTPRDREVIELRFGLLGGDARSLGDIAQRFGVTRERIRQIEMRALRKFREPRYRKLLAGFVRCE
jgi:RNA polymerase primary sigma factor